MSSSSNHPDPAAPRRRARAPVALLLLVPFARAAGQASAAIGPQPDRPRVALVLSGGGARGAAHVGVLQVLEELRVPVDFVVGTSMGAIVGGLYAAGYSPDRLAEILRDADWSLLLSDEVPRDELWFRRRQDNRHFQVDAQVGWRHGGLALPPGLVLGRNVEAFLEQLTLSAAETEDFDRLRLPFRCVATDLADGSAVVFDRGNLARAIRASMSLPGIFAPAEHEGRQLVDGGAVDNIPVDVARRLGADVVIVVDISTPVRELESTNPLAVSNQVVGILMSTNRSRALEMLEERDVLVTPELGTLGPLSFERIEEAIEVGRVEAGRVRARLSELGVGAGAWRDYLARQRLVEPERRIVRRLVIESDTRLSERVVRRFSAIREGQALDPRALERTRQQLIGLGVFEGIEVDLVPVPGEGGEAPQGAGGPEGASAAGEVDVVLRTTAKSWGPNYLRFGLGVSSDLTGGGDFALGVQHTSTPLNALGGEWRNEVEIGTRTRLFTEFYQPLDVGLRWFVSPSIEYRREDVDINSGGDTLAVVDAEALQLQLAVGRNLGSWGELRVAYGWTTVTIRPEVILPGLLPPKITEDSATVGAALTADTLDSITFPRRGVVGGLAWDQSGQSATSGDRTAHLQGLLGIPVTKRRLTVFTSIEGGVTLEGEQPFGAEFSLGGFRRLSGLGPGTLTGNHYALAVVQPYYQLSDRQGLFGMARYLGGSIEYGGIWQELDRLEEDDLLLGASLYLGLDTLLGPVFVGAGLTEGGERSAYVSIGPTF